MRGEEKQHVPEDLGDEKLRARCNAAIVKASAIADSMPAYDPERNEYLRLVRDARLFIEAPGIFKRERVRRALDLFDDISSSSLYVPARLLELEDRIARWESEATIVGREMVALERRRAIEQTSPELEEVGDALSRAQVALRLLAELKRDACDEIRRLRSRASN